MRPTVSSNSVGDVHRFLAGHRVDDEQRVVRACTASRTCAQLVHELGVDLQTAGGVDDHDVAAEARGFLERAARDAAPGRSARSSTGTPTRSPSTRSCSTAAGRWRSAPTSSGRRPWLLSSRASFADAVVFPEPWRPAIITTVGGFDDIVSLPVVPPSVVDQLLVHDLDDLLRGAEALRDLGAGRALLHPAR